MDKRAASIEGCSVMLSSLGNARIRSTSAFPGCTFALLATTAFMRREQFLLRVRIET
jgi:hypothetical protein